MRTFLNAAALGSVSIMSVSIAAPALAQKTPSAVIVTVDNEKIFAECNACKTAQTQLQTQAQQLQTFAQQLGQPLQTEAEAIQKAAAGKPQPDAALQARIRALQTKETQANQQLQQRQQTFQRNRVYVNQQINEKLGPIIQQVMTSKGANIALDVNATLAAGSSLDVTNEVMAQLNTQLPAVSTTAPAPPASASTGGR